VAVIMGRQLEDGSWAQEDIEGIFVSRSFSWVASVEKLEELTALFC